MAKNFVKKRRVPVRAAHDEAVVVAPLEFWETFEKWCGIMAEDNPEYSRDWEATARWISYWVERTKDKSNDKEELERY